MKTKVLVTVKTYPRLSEKHLETVCTAGFRENGEWIRIYPIPFRLLYNYDKGTYAKWQWIEVDLEKNPRDDRPESYRIRDIETLELGNKIDKNEYKRNWILKNKTIYRNMDELLEKTKANEISLAVLKPVNVIDVTCEKEDSGKFIEKLNKIKAAYEIKRKQLKLFEEQQVIQYSFNFAEQIPYKFRYKFTTEDGKVRHLMIEDWEIGMLYRNCCKKHSQEEACNLVREKYLDMAQKRELYLFLGTTFQWQKKNAPDPYVIVGVFSHPKIMQLSFGFEE